MRIQTENQHVERRVRKHHWEQLLQDAQALSSDTAVPPNLETKAEPSTGLSAQSTHTMEALVPAL